MYENTISFAIVKILSQKLLESFETFQKLGNRWFFFI